MMCKDEAVVPKCFFPEVVVFLLHRLPDINIMVGGAVFFAESFVNKESMCNFAAQFNREIFLTINI